MATRTGYFSLADLRVPASVNAQMEKVELGASGWTVAELLEEFYLMAEGIGAELLGAGELGGLLSGTTYRSPNAIVSVPQGAPLVTGDVEFAPDDPSRLEAAAWHIARVAHVTTLGYTWQALEQAPVERIITDIAARPDAIRTAVLRELARAVYITADRPVGGHGGTGTQRGFCNGTVSTVPYAPPPVVGFVHDATHDHRRANAGNDSAALLAELAFAAPHLRHHGIRATSDGPVLLLHSADDMARVTGLAGYLPVVPAGIAATAMQSWATPPAWLPSHGAVSVGGLAMQCVEMPFAPPSYYAVVKSHGQDSPRNALRYTYPDWRGPLAVPIGAEPGQSARQVAHDLGLLLEVGIGVQRPEAGFLIRLGAGTWADPTIA